MRSNRLSFSRLSRLGNTIPLSGVSSRIVNAKGPIADSGCHEFLGEEVMGGHSCGGEPRRVVEVGGGVHGPPYSASVLRLLLGTVGTGQVSLRDKGMIGTVHIIDRIYI